MSSTFSIKVKIFNLNKFYFAWLSACLC